MDIPLLNQGPVFSKKEAKQIKERFYKDKEFRTMFIKLKNAWLMRKIDMETWGEYLKKSLEKSLEKEGKKQNLFAALWSALKRAIKKLLGKKQE